MKVLILTYFFSFIGHLFDNLCWFDTDSHWSEFKQMSLKDKIKFLWTNKISWIARNTRDVFSTIVGALLFLLTPTHFWLGWAYASSIMLFSLTVNFLFWFKRNSFWEMFGLRDIIPCVIIGFIVSLIM